MNQEFNFDDAESDGYVILIKTVNEEIPQSDVEENMEKFGLNSKFFLNAMIPFKISFQRGLTMFLTNLTASNKESNEFDDAADIVSWVKKKVFSNKEKDVYEIIKEIISPGIEAVRFESDFKLHLNKADEDFIIEGKSSEKEGIKDTLNACILESETYFKASDIKRMVKEFFKNSAIDFLDKKLGAYWLPKEKLPNFESIYKFCEATPNISLVLLPVKMA
jgi:hypothetical protein